MKKRILSAVLIVCTLLAITSCSGKLYDIEFDKYIKLGNYTGVEYTYSVEPVTDADVEARILSDMKDGAYGEEKEVTDRPVKVGDVVTIDYAGYMDGEQFAGGTANDAKLEIGSNKFIAGFEDGLVGAELNEKRTLDLNFPDPYENSPDLSGKPVSFEVTVKGITETVFPELTEEIVKEISDYETVDEYKSAVRTELEEEAVATANENKNTQIWSAVVNDTEVISYPKNELKSMEKRVISELESQAAQNNITLDELFEQSGYDQERRDELIKQRKEGGVKELMVVYAIAKAEGITMTDQEVEETALGIAQQNGYSTASQIFEMYSKENFTQDLLYGKVVELVVSKAVEKQ